MLKILTIIMSLGFVGPIYSKALDYMPETIYQLDNKFAHHVIVVEKSTHSLFLYKNENSLPVLLRKFQIATGKMKGNKVVQGDKKTPEGVYIFKRFHSSEDLINKYGKTGLIYGAGAFTMNYPNEMDRRRGKTGGGIWLHSTDNDARVNKGLDSRGCVVAVDSDLKEISKYIDLNNTPVVIVQNLNFLTQENWRKNQEEIKSLVQNWANGWTSKNLEQYISNYSKEKFKHNIKGGYYSYKNYKRRVFARKDNPKINFSNISILSNGDYALVTMEQNYNSEVIQDIGKKKLYLKKNSNYDWKIVAEVFTKLDETNRDVAFVPSMRYFKEDQNKNVSKNL